MKNLIKRVLVGQGVRQASRSKPFSVACPVLLHGHLRCTVYGAKPVQCEIAEWEGTAVPAVTLAR